MKKLDEILSGIQVTAQHVRDLEFARDEARVQVAALQRRVEELTRERDQARRGCDKKTIQAVMSGRASLNGVMAMAEAQGGLALCGVMMPEEWPFALVLTIGSASSEVGEAWAQELRAHHVTESARRGRPNELSLVCWMARALQRPGQIVLRMPLSGVKHTKPPPCRGEYANDPLGRCECCP